MNATTRKPGFYATEADTFYLAPSGRSWLVASDDELPTVRECEIPAEADSADGLLTPEESLGYCRQIEAESGETLAEEA